MTRAVDETDILTAGFKTFLEAYDRDCPFRRQGQLEHHVATIRRRRALGSAKAAIGDEQFLHSLYETLRAWGIGSRASRLRPFKDFADALRAKTDEIVKLDGLAIDQPTLQVDMISGRLGHLVQTLDIVSNKARVVPGSKALHHLLPELVVPIDRNYTQWFFEWPTPRLQYQPEACFSEAFEAFAKVARSANPAQYVGSGWYTCRTKVIDNAVVGVQCWIRRKQRLKKG